MVSDHKSISLILSLCNYNKKCQVFTYLNFPESFISFNEGTIVHDAFKSVFAHAYLFLSNYILPLHPMDYSCIVVYDIP
jgi:hypothetical protein